MADDVQRVEEENNSLREEIEQVQQERRAGFAKAEELSRSVTVQEENERLKEVLASQKKILEREDAIRGDIKVDESKGDAPSYDTPYTQTPKGRVYSGEADVVTDSNSFGDNDENEEN